MTKDTCFACGREAVAIHKEEDHGEPGRRRRARGENAAWPVCKTRVSGKPCVPYLKLLPGEKPAPVSSHAKTLAKHYERKLAAEGL